MVAVTETYGLLCLKYLLSDHATRVLEKISLYKDTEVQLYNNTNHHRPSELQLHSNMKDLPNIKLRESQKQKNMACIFPGAQ